MTATHRNLVITRIREELPDVKTFFLVAEDGESVPYRAGQFLTFIFHQYGREERRSYSVSSSPDADEPLAITVKRIANGRYSRPLFDKARVGDKLVFAGAAGLFTSPDDLNAYGRMVLFAAGIGITPLFSLLKSALVKNASIKIVLVYSNRSVADAVFYKELLALQQIYPERFSIAWLFSNDKHADRARLSKSLMPSLLQKYASGNLAHTLCYTCGPYSYMWLVALLMEEAGMPRDNIRREIFVNDQEPLREMPPDKSTRRVTVQQGNESFSFEVHYPDSILQAALKAGHYLPYSCEAGRCSSCAAHCTEGKIWMSYNEVLTEKELAQGMVLTCTGHPVGGDVVIEFNAASNFVK